MNRRLHRGEEGKKQMAIKRLTTEEMVQISGPWVAEGTEARNAILAVDELKGLLPRVEAAHKALHETQPGPGNPRLAELQAEAAEEDLQHDTLIRGTHMLLTALALLGGASADGLLRLRDFLLPDGLEATQKSYRAEAGAADLLKTRLAGDPSVKKQLKDVPVLKQTLWHFVEGWLSRAKKLSDLEDERARIAAPGGPGDAAVVLAARNQWIRAVNALLANGDLAELDAATDRTIFGALRLAERAADRRGRAPASEPAEPPTPPAADKEPK